MTQRMRFGIFLAPIHKPGINPARARAARPELADIHSKAVDAAILRYPEKAARRAG